MTVDEDRTIRDRVVRLETIVEGFADDRKAIAADIREMKTSLASLNEIMAQNRGGQRIVSRIATFCVALISAGITWALGHNWK